MLETIPVLATRALRAVRPGLPSRPLFVLVPIGCLVAAAWALARAAVALGTSGGVAFLAGVALPLATPLWGYAASDLSEPLQAASLAVAIAAAVVLRREKEPGRRWEIAAGLAAGMALLAKSLLVCAALPLVAAAALPPPPPDTEEKKKSRRRSAPARPPLRLTVLAAFAVPAVTWGVFELVRFGRLFGGYEGEGFGGSLADGLLGLTVLPNKGLLWYAPFVLLAPWGFARLRARDGALALAVAAPVVALFAAVASWWAWDGNVGWGPRLLVPTLPFLVLLATLASVERSAEKARPLFAVLVAAGVAVNALGAFVPFAGVDAAAAYVGPVPIAPKIGDRLTHGTRTLRDGTLVAAPYIHLARNPSWSPLRIHGRLLLERLRGGDVAGRLLSGALADLTPPFVPRAAPPSLVASPLTIGFWGRSWIAPLDGGLDPYDWAEKDQELRLRERGR